MNNNQMVILIKNLSRERKTTPTQVFRKIGLSKSFINNLESGSKPSVESIEKLADYFNVSTDYILGREEEPKGINISNNENVHNNNIGYQNVSNNIELSHLEMAIAQEIKKLSKAEQIKLLEQLNKE